MKVYQSSLIISDCTFSTTQSGGVLESFESSVMVIASTFTLNKDLNGGVISARNDRSMSIVGCTFANNYASYGGVMDIMFESTLYLVNCTFTNNSAYYAGGVINTKLGSRVTIYGSTFVGNIAFSGDN